MPQQGPRLQLGPAGLNPPAKAHANDRPLGLAWAQGVGFVGCAHRRKSACVAFLTPLIDETDIMPSTQRAPTRLSCAVCGRQYQHSGHLRRHEASREFYPRDVGLIDACLQRQTDPE